MSRDAEMRGVLERLWKYNAPRADVLDYELVVLAIPRFPANIEAIAALDMDTLCELMQGYIDARKAQNEERRNALSSSGSEGREACEVAGPPVEPWATSTGAADGQALGQDNGDPGGTRQERPDAAAEAHEGDAAEDAVGLTITRSGDVVTFESDHEDLYDHLKAVIDAPTDRE